MSSETRQVLGLVRIHRPLLDEVTELLAMRGGERADQRQTRVEARLEHDHDVGNQQSAVLR